MLEEADVVVIHDPQPAALLRYCERRRGKWIWRGHIDISRPFRPLWKELRAVLERYDASIFSMAEFAQLLPHPQFLVSPSIDPLSEKNRDLAPAEIEEVRAEYRLDPSRPLLVQISRFDRFKDPLGVIGQWSALGWSLGRALGDDGKRFAQPRLQIVVGRCINTHASILKLYQRADQRFCAQSMPVHTGA